jgi:tRNA-dihydrouridine synthase B
MTSEEFVKRLREEKLVLPPLAGYTDYPYRRILAEFDAPFICTEMVSCDAVVRGNPRTQKMLMMSEGDHLNGAQLFGEAPDMMAAAAETIEYLGFDYVDINMGCAVKSITQNGAGVSLMGEPEKAAQVVRRVVEAVSIPVTCKMRLGESRSELNALELSKRLAEAGVSAITVHGRSGEKKFGEKVDLKAIREVVEAIDVPVVGNGGVFSGADAVVMMESTSVDAVMPGRGLIGNPWIIGEIRSALKGTPFAAPSLEERKTVCRRHLEYLVEHSGEKDGVLTMRRVLPRYFIGAVHATDLRIGMTSVSTIKEVLDKIDKITQIDDQMVFLRD